MPSTRSQKAKARKSREMDMMSDFDNMDVMIGNENINPIERELSNAIEKSSVLVDIESNTFTQEANSEDLIVKITNIGQMKQETTWKISRRNSTLGCPRKWIP